ncbi:MAG: hypothetical protein ACXABY_26070 [Candidatus Thorarchaeota archaeon]|jgi:hypothetical protein
MAVSNLVTQQIYTGDDVTTAFAIPFDFDLEAEIRVVLRDESGTTAIETVQTLGVDYTLSGGPPVTTVDMTTAPTSTDKLLVIRQSAKTQPTDLLETSTLPAETIESSLDHAIFLLQEVCQKLNRAPLLAESTPTSGIVLPEPAATQFLAWNAAGTNLENQSTAPTASGDLTQSSGAIADGQAATAVSGWTLDAADFTSAIYAVEIFRPATTDLMSSGLVMLQRVEGAWRIDNTIFSTLDVSSGAPAGTTLTVSEAAGVAQVEAATTAEAGGLSGTIKFKRIGFTV